MHSQGPQRLIRADGEEKMSKNVIYDQNHHFKNNIKVGWLNHGSDYE